jgi:hypothetical protein
VIDIIKLTHHFNDKNLDELAKKEGLNSEKVVDYSEVDQGTDSQPRMAEVQSFQPKAKGSGKKGGRKNKKTAKTSGEAPKTIKDKIRCSSCNNLMIQSTKLNYKEIPGKKMPKGAEGKALFKSPGGSAVGQGKVSGVLCDDCNKALEAGKPISINTAVLENVSDGTLSNVPVGELLT